MVRSAKETAEDILKAWSKYKLKEWAIMSIAGIIFVTGYVLGTLNWRKGASRLFVVLDIVLGTAGFFYFCYKGLQIFAEAHDEILAAIYSTQVQVESGESSTTSATYNNYVTSQAVLGHLQLPKIQNQNSFVDDPGLENSYMEFYPYRGSTLALEHNAANVSCTEENGQASKEAPNVYLKPSHLKLCNFSRCDSHASQVQPSTAVHFNNSESVYGNLSSGIYSNYQVPPRGSLQTQRHCGHSASTELVNCMCRCMNKHVSVGVCECRTRSMHATTSESSLLSLRGDPMQHYKVPKTLSIYPHLVSSPDPNRHLKPQPTKTKPLPAAPSSVSHLSYPDQYVLCKPGLEESPLPSYSRVMGKVKAADEAGAETRPGLEPSPRPNACGSSNDPNVEEDAGLKQTWSKCATHGELKDETQVRCPEIFPQCSLVQESDPSCSFGDEPDSLRKLPQTGNATAPNDLATEPNSTNEPQPPTPSSYKENDSISEGQDEMSSSESFQEHCTAPYICLQDDVSQSEDTLEYKQGLEPSPEPYKDSIGNSLHCEDFHYADQSFQSPPGRPPRVETPLPTFYPPQEQFVFPQRGHTLLQHRLSMPINYHMFVTPGSASSQSQASYFNQTSANRSFTPVSRYMSHPVSANSRAPSRYLPPAKKSSSSSSSSSPPKSSGTPVPKKRVTPPFREWSTPRGQSKRSPPMMPRKTGSPR